jgi:hypothetical protein
VSSVRCLRLDVWRVRLEVGPGQLLDRRRERVGKLASGDQERAEPERGVDLGGIWALAMSLAEPWRFEVRLRFENSELDLGPKALPANGDFLLARTDTGGELVDLTKDDIRLWMFWLGLDYILNR